MRAFEFRHVVTFEETNLVGNVYFVNHIRWQGLCREMFLREQAPGVLSELRDGLLLVTVRCSCEYLAEVFALDEILIRMSLKEVTQNRVTMLFEYVRTGGSGDEIFARGEQQIACMRKQGDRAMPAPIPPELRDVLKRYEMPQVYLVDRIDHSV
jgi:enediyne biosynthesis thioesterase